MNITYPPSNFWTAKICDCKEMNKQKVTYAFSGDFHSLCRDKKDIVESEIEACDVLLKHTINESEREIIEKEIIELKTAFDLTT
jgi:hypothetical protein